MLTTTTRVDPSFLWILEWPRPAGLLTTNQPIVAVVGESNVLRALAAPGITEVATSGQQMTMEMADMKGAAKSAGTELRSEDRMEPAQRVRPRRDMQGCRAAHPAVLAHTDLVILEPRITAGHLERGVAASQRPGQRGAAGKAERHREQSHCRSAAAQSRDCCLGHRFFYRLDDRERWRGDTSARSAAAGGEWP